MASDDLLGALQTAEAWRTQAETSGDKARLLSALRLATRVYCDRQDGNVKALKRDLEVGLPLARERADVEAEAELLLWSADRQARDNERDAALSAFTAAIEFAERHGLGDHAAYARAFKARMLINRLSRAADGMAELVQAYGYFERQHNQLGMGQTSFMMGWVFGAAPEAEAKSKSIGYYQRALKHLDPVRNRNYTAYVLLFLGTHYRFSGEPDNARQHYSRSLALRQELKDFSGAANVELQLANMDLAEAKYERALAAFQRIAAIFESTGEIRFKLSTLISIIQTLSLLNRQQEAAETLIQARALARKIASPSAETGVEAAAMKFHAQFGQYQQAYEASLAYNKARQEELNQNRSTEAAAIERKFADRLKEEMQQKELVLAESRRVSQLAMLAAFTVLIIALAGWVLLDFKRKAEKARRNEIERANVRLEEQVVARTSELEGEKKRAEGLLRNTLPDAVIAELKATGKVRPRRHESISVLFTDFAGFTTISSTLPPDRLLVELSDIFGSFDAIVEAEGLEKIKTIGDSYMAAAGLHQENDNHAEACVRAAQSMVAYLEKRNAQSAFKWQLRLGIHSGPVIAGVVGTSRFAYDIWGDTVNLASRMESVGVPGTITLSAYTVDLLQGRIAVEYRGKVDVKGKGPLDIYIAKPI